MFSKISSLFYLIIILLPTYQIRWSLLGVPMTFLELLILALALGWVYHLVSTKTLPRFFAKKYRVVHMFTILVLITSTISLFIAPDLRAAAGIYKAYIIEPILFFIISFDVLKSKASYTMLVYSLGITSLYISLWGIMQSLFGFGLLEENYQGGINYRITSVFAYPNAVGLFVAPIVALFTPKFFEELPSYKQYKKSLLFSGGVIIFGIIAILLAETEAAFVAYILMLGCYFLYKTKYRLTALLTGITASYFFTKTFPEITNKIIAKLTLQDFSGHIRRHIYTETAHMLDSVGIWGAGLAGYKTAMQPIHQDIIWIGKVLQPVEIYLYPHSIWFNFYSELGFFGAITIISGVIFLSVTLIYALFRKSTSAKYSMMALAALIVWGVHGLVDVPFFKNDLAILFWLLIALGIFATDSEIWHTDKKNV